jgi:hypothetical protein
MSIKVKDLVAYLLKYNQEATIILDKNGWEEGETPEEIIGNTGLIAETPNTKSDYIVINN